MRSNRRSIIAGVTAAGALALTLAVGTGASAEMSSASAAKATAHHKPVLHVKLTPVHGTKPGRVKLKVHMWGYAYLPLGGDGRPISMPNPAGMDIVTGTQYRWGDGSPQGGSDGGDVSCGRPHVLRKVEDTYVAGAHTYRPGTYTIRYTVHACGLKHPKTVRTPVHVR